MLHDQEARQLLATEHDRVATLLGNLHIEEFATPTDEMTHADEHHGDNGHDDTDRWREVELRKKLEAELTEIAAAHERLDAGRFGLCEACGQPIGDERLRALPATRRCRDHSR